MVRCLWFFGSLFDDGSGSFHYCDHPYSGAVLPVQRSYINARERLRLRWTKKKRSKQTKKKPTERDANWWPAKCLPNMNQWLISCRYPQGDGFFLVWCSTFCAKSQHKHHSGGKKKRKKCSGIGYSSKEAFCKLGTRKPPGGVKATQGNEGQQLLWGLNVGVFASCMAPGSSGEDLGGRC